MLSKPNDVAAVVLEAAKAGHNELVPLILGAMAVCTEKTAGCLPTGIAVAHFRRSWRPCGAILRQGACRISASHRDAGPGGDPDEIRQQASQHLAHRQKTAALFPIPTRRHNGAGRRA